MTTAKKKRAKKAAALLPHSPSDVASPLDDIDVPALVRDLGALIDGARKQVSIMANPVLSALYWQIGNRRADVLDGRRAEHGAQIVAAVSRQWDGPTSSSYSAEWLRTRLGPLDGSRFAASAAIRVWATRAVAVQQVAEHAASPSQQR